MSEQAESEQASEQPQIKDESVTWGPKLFYGVLIAVLVFFWWMVIYPHGVTPVH